MNRSDLRWALDAVLPHTGRTAETDVVGLTQDGEYNLVVYATDRYTFGAARVAAGPHVDVRLTTKEARELLKFVRPERVAHNDHEVIMLVRDNELHVGFCDEDGETYTSAVFDTVERGADLNYLERFVDWLSEHETEYQACIFRPKIFGRFSKAERYETDRLHLLPKRLDDRHGAALVMVGKHFVGAIAGMSYDQPLAALEDPDATTERIAA